MSINVVIVDQDVKLARLYRRFLAGHGVSAEIAQCGLDCLKMINQHPPDVLVLDHDFPWGDGEGVLACLREDGLSLPVILTTWAASPQSVHELVAPPVVLCLRKFFPLPVLLHGVLLTANTREKRDPFSGRVLLTEQEVPTWTVSR